MSVHELFGCRLRSLREQRGLTQQMLGEKAGVGYKYLGAVERGQENPSLKVISRLADALEVELDELFKFHHESTNPNELKSLIQELLEKADLPQLQQTVKLLRSLIN